MFGAANTLLLVELFSIADRIVCHRCPHTAVQSFCSSTFAKLLDCVIRPFEVGIELMYRLVDGELAQFAGFGDDQNHDMVALLDVLDDASPPALSRLSSGGPAVAVAVRCEPGSHGLATRTCLSVPYGNACPSWKTTRSAVNLWVGDTKSDELVITNSSPDQNQVGDAALAISVKYNISLAVYSPCPQQYPCIAAVMMVSIAIFLT